MTKIDWEAGTRNHLMHTSKLLMLYHPKNPCWLFAIANPQLRVNLVASIKQYRTAKNFFRCFKSAKIFSASRVPIPEFRDARTKCQNQEENFGWRIEVKLERR